MPIMIGCYDGDTFAYFNSYRQLLSTPHLLLNLNNNKKEKEAAAAKKVSAAIIFMSIINGCFYMFLWHPR